MNTEVNSGNGKAVLVSNYAIGFAIGFVDAIPHCGNVLCINN